MQVQDSHQGHVRKKVWKYRADYFKNQEKTNPVYHFHTDVGNMPGCNGFCDSNDGENGFGV